MKWTEEQFKSLLGKSSKKNTVAITDGYRSNKRGWRTIGGKKYYLKSLYEINYANYLEWLRTEGLLIDWEYEPKTFKFPKDSYKAGPFYYKPDFRVAYKNSVEWHEVKGWMNPSSKKKIKRFHKHFPEEGSLVIIDSAWFKEAYKKGFKTLIPGWEGLNS